MILAICISSWKLIERIESNENCAFAKQTRDNTGRGKTSSKLCSSLIPLQARTDHVKNVYILRQIRKRKWLFFIKHVDPMTLPIEEMSS